MSIMCILAVASLICTLVSAATGKVPLWVALLLLNITILLTCLPLK